MVVLSGNDRGSNLNRVVALSGTRLEDLRVESEMEIEEIIMKFLKVQYSANCCSGN